MAFRYFTPGLESPLPPPGRLDRFALGLPDFGVEDADELKRDALRAAMARLGGDIIAEAAEGRGFAGAGPGIKAAGDVYRESLLDAAEERRRGEAHELGSEAERSKLAYYAGKESREAEEAETARKEAEAELAKQDAVLAKLDPEQRARLEPHRGTKKFYERLFTVTEPEEEEEEFDLATDPGYQRWLAQKRHEKAEKIGAYEPPPPGPKPESATAIYREARQLAQDEYDQAVATQEARNKRLKAMWNEIQVGRREAGEDVTGRKPPEYITVPKDFLKRRIEYWADRLRAEGGLAPAPAELPGTQAGGGVQSPSPSPESQIPAEVAADPEFQNLVALGAREGKTPDQVWEDWLRTIGQVMRE